MIKFISFDLDDTLWAIMPMIVHAEEKLQHWLGDHIPGYTEHITREELATLREAVLQESPSLRFDISSLRVRCIERAIARCYTLDSRDLKASEITQQAAEAFDVFMQGRNDVRFFPHALEVLADLRRRFRLCGLTNGNADTKRIGLDDYFDFCMSPVQAQARKPDAAIFSATLARAQCSAAEIIHVGDHPTEDIAGAKAAGWRAIWLRHEGLKGLDSRLTTDPQADATITTLNDLPAAISRIASLARSD